jgi:hypothetical protein
MRHHAGFEARHLHAVGVTRIASGIVRAWYRMGNDRRRPIESAPRSSLSAGGFFVGLAWCDFSEQIVSGLPGYRFGNGAKSMRWPHDGLWNFRIRDCRVQFRIVG